MAPSSGGPGRQPRRQHENRSGSNPIGENSRSTQQWKGVPRGTMDEVSSHVGLDLRLKQAPSLPETPRRDVKKPQRSKAFDSTARKVLRGRRQSAAALMLRAAIRFTPKATPCCGAAK